jgi:alpha-ribazole phosphatase
VPLILRHPRPAISPGLCYGRADLALAPGWEAEAEALLRALPPVVALRSSPLTRCRQLAERISDARALPLAVDPRLTEIDFGSWETRPWDDIPRAELDAWAADFHHARPHGGESVAMLADRVAQALSETPPGTLWVTHAGVARAVAALTGHPEGWDLRLDYGAFVSLG